MSFLNFGRDDEEPKRSFFGDLKAVGGFIADKATGAVNEISEDLGVLSSYGKQKLQDLDQAGAKFITDKSADIGKGYEDFTEGIQIKVGQEVNKFVDNKEMWRDANEATQNLPFFDEIHRIPASVAVGEAGLASQLGRGFEWLGMDSLKPYNDKLDAWAKEFTPEDQTGLETFYTVLGSSLPFYMLGMGTAKMATGLLGNVSSGTGMIAKYSPAIMFALKELPNVASSVTEAMVEAGGAWQESKDMGQTEQQADFRAATVFVGNVGVNYIMNKVGIFSSPKAKGVIKQYFTNILMEGGQEDIQQFMQNVSAHDGRDWFAGMVENFKWGALVSALVGTAGINVGTSIDPNIQTAVSNNLKTADQVVANKIDSENVADILENAKGNVSKQIAYGGNEKAAKIVENINVAKMKTVEQLRTRINKELKYSGVANAAPMISMEKSVKAVADKFKLSKEDATKFVLYMKDMEASGTIIPPSDKFVGDVVEKAEEEMGQVPSSILEVQNQISATITEPASDIQREAQDMVMSEGEIGSFKSVDSVEGITSQQSSVRSDDFNFKTFTSENEVVAYLKSQKAKTLDEAMAKDKKFDGYALEYEKETRYKVTNKAKLEQVMESKNFLTTSEAQEQAKGFPFIEKTGVTLQAVNNLKTVKGERVWGSYKNAMIKFLENPHKTTVPHEAAHAFLDLMMTPKEKQAILNEVKRRYAGKNYTNAQAEERLVQDFAESLEKGDKAKAPSTKLGKFFNWLKGQFNSLFSKDNVDIIDKFYADIQSDPTRKQVRKAIRKIRGSDINALQEEYAQNPRALTTKLFKNVDVANRDMLPVQWLKDLIKSKSANLRPVEQELLLDVLNTQQFEGQKKISKEDFQEAVASELLTLEIIETDTYASYGSENVSMENGVVHKTLLFNSPYEHGSTGYFSGDFEVFMSASNLDIVQVPTKTDWAIIRKGVTLTEENLAENVFNVTKTKEEAEAWVRNHKSEETKKEINVMKRGLFAHARVFEADTKISHIAEIQSDVFQEGRVMGKAKYSKYAKMNFENDIETNNKEIKDKKESIETVNNYISLIEENKYKTDELFNVENLSNEDIIKDISNKYGIPVRDIKEFSDFLIERNGEINKKEVEFLLIPRKDKIREIEFEISHFENFNEKLRGKIAKASWDKLGKENPELARAEEKFFQYKNEWHIRTIKELIRLKSMEGFETLRFPTAYTVSSIEGYLVKENAVESEGDFDIENLDSGQKTVADFYEKRIYKELMKLRNKEVERVTDDNGFTWNEIKQI